jgi:3' terminal RNA ribose 2'-O-methyltransferase Hen1
MTTDLHAERTQTVVDIVISSRAESVIDLGCGSGELLAHLAREDRIRRLVGVDISMQALSEACELLGCDSNMRNGRISLFEIPFTRPDDRLTGFDAALMVETIEHVPPNELSLLERTVFSLMRPGIVVITTPNQEYNVLHGMRPGAKRHPGHFFEWTRARFSAWAGGVARRNGYSVIFGDIGVADPLLGSSTQMAIFSVQNA